MLLRSLEICAGAGGQAIGLEAAGFEHLELVEIDNWACETLAANRPHWKVYRGDLRDYISENRALELGGIDLIAGGVPCPPFSVAGKQLGEHDERNLFEEAIRLILQTKPKALLIENVRGLLDKRFDQYRESIKRTLVEGGYHSDWRLVRSSDFGVPQLRPRSVLVGTLSPYWKFFEWPAPSLAAPPSVGEVLYPLISSDGWTGAKEWKQKANTIAPTIVGGSKKHGGADLGPTRAKAKWRELGVDPMGISNSPPKNGFLGAPKLTVQMVARLQGFPQGWEFKGPKTAAYRQVGNAFPPPVAEALGKSLAECLRKASCHAVVK